MDELARPYVIDGRQVNLSVSIGIALAPTDGSDAAELMRSADLALSRAKTQRRGGFCFFEPEIDSRLRQRRELENELAQALIRNQLRLHYQPLFDATGLGLVGFEALLRWVHPVRDQIAPAEFIPIAEESGLIVPIGTWVLETACAKAASWPRPLRIAVNLSPVQFGDDGLVATVERALRRHDLPPGRLELEITEGVLINDVERALATVRALKALGVVIALDDFGTGYSSLSYLRRFPFDKIKIDRSFVQALGEDEDAEAIVQSIIAMGRSLKLAVTAEGVETDAQLDLLRGLQCSEVQGFLLGRPTAEPTIDPLRAKRAVERRSIRSNAPRPSLSPSPVIQNNRVRSLSEEQPAFHE